MVFAAEYTTATLAGWVAVALVVGLVVGWLVRPWLVGDRLRDDYDSKLRDERGARSAAESDLESTTSLVADLKGELEVIRGDLARVKAELAASRSRAAEMETQVGSLAMEKDAEIARLAAEAGKVSSLEVAMGERDSRIAALEEELAARDVEAARSKAVAEAAEAARARLRGNEQALETEQKRAQAAERALLDAEAKKAETAARLEEAAARAAELEAELEKRATAPTPGIQERTVGASPAAADQEPAVSTVAVAEVTDQAAVTRPEPVHDDDLRKIKGIGPAIERQLKAMGITSFLQVANLGAAERARIGEALGSFANRMERDDWMTSAARLHEEKYGPGG